MTKRRAISQSKHEEINRRSYPGTRQLCYVCNESTDRCEEDGYYDISGYSYCEQCFNLRFREEIVGNTSINQALKEAIKISRNLLIYCYEEDKKYLYEEKLNTLEREYLYNNGNDFDSGKVNKIY